MADSPAVTPVAIRYRAFLSYSHADISSAEWLHRAIEHFRIDRDLIGRATPIGPVPKALQPIFRDHEESAGSLRLGDATIAALDASAALIVLCSTDAAARPAINEQIWHFRSHYPERPVIPVIVEGTYPNNIPSALHFDLAADGSVTERAVAILRSDLRDNADGKALGLVKCVAGLIGLSNDEMVLRAERKRRRRARLRIAAVGALAFFAIAASGGAIYAWHQFKTDETFFHTTLDHFTSLLNRGVDTANAFSLPLPVTLGALGEIEGLLRAIVENDGNRGQTPRVKYRQAVMLLTFADAYRDLGQTDDTQRRIAQARRILEDLVRTNPDNVEWGRALARAKHAENVGGNGSPR